MRLLKASFLPAFLWLAIVLLGACKFEPDIEPIAFPTAPPQPFSQFAPQIEATQVELEIAPALESEFGAIQRQEGGLEQALPWVIAGAALGAVAGAGAVAARRGFFTFSPRIKRILWLAPTAAALASFGLGASRCTSEICYAQTFPGGPLVIVECEDEEPPEEEADEDDVTATPPGGVDPNKPKTPGPGEEGGGSEDVPVNSRGEPYPEVTDPRTGEPIPSPPNDLEIVPQSERVNWTNSDRADFIREWHERGFAEPEGGWSNYDIHHITPREYGGTNNFENLVPVERGIHQQELNPWWQFYEASP